MARSIDILIRLRQAGGQIVGRINSQINRLRANLDQLQAASGALVTAGTQVALLGGALAATAAVPVKFAADFETSINNVRALLEQTIDDSGELEKAFNSLRNEALRLGETTQFTATQAAEAIENLTRAGFSAEESIAALGATLNLAAVEGIEIAQAAEITANILRGFGLSAKDTGRAVDILANTTTNTAVRLIDLSEALKTAGPIAASAGVSLRDTAAVLGAFGDAGLKGSIAGTQFRAIIRSLVAPSKESAEIIKRLGLVISDASGRFVGVRSIVAQLQEILKNVGGEAERTGILMEVFGQRGGPGMAALLKQGDVKLLQLEQRLDRQGTAAGVAETRLASLQGSFVKLTSAAQGFLINVGTPFLNFLTRFVNQVTRAVQRANEFFQSLGGIGTFFVGFVGVLGGVVATVGALAVAAGSAGLAFVSLKIGMTALLPLTSALSAKFTLLNVSMGAVLGKITLIAAAFTTGFAIGKAIADFEVFGLTVQTIFDVVVAKIAATFSAIKIRLLELRRTASQVLEKVGVGGEDLSLLDKRIEAEKRHKKSLEEAAVAIVRKRTETKRAADEARRQAPRAVAEAPTAGIAPDVRDIQRQQEQLKREQELLHQREQILKRFVALSETEITRLQSLQRQGLVDSQKVVEARQQLAVAAANEEIAIIKEQIRLQQDANERRNLETKLIEKQNELKRKLILLGEEENRSDEALARSKREVNEQLAQLEKRVLGDSLSDLKRKHQLELEELDRRHSEEIEKLRDKNATVQQLEEAAKNQSLERLRLQTEQAAQVRERQERITREMQALERQGLGSDPGGIRRRNELEIAALDRANQEKIKNLEKLGANEQQILEAQRLASLALQQKRADQEKQLSENLAAEEKRRQDRRREELRKAQELQSRLLEVERGAVNPANLEEQNRIRIEQLKIRQEQQLQSLRDFGITQQQEEQVRAQQQITLTRETTRQQIEIINFRLNAAQQLAGGLSSAFAEAFRATGEKNREFFIASKAAAIAQATINIAQAITKALAEGGAILGPIQAAFIAALGAVQIAKITAARLHGGGEVRGGSGRRDDVPAILTSGEYVVRRESVNYYGSGLIEAINRISIPRSVIAENIGGALPSPNIPPTLSFQTGGLVPAFETQQPQQGGQQINILNFTDPAQIDQHLASSAGQENLINILNNNRDELRTIVIGT